MGTLYVMHLVHKSPPPLIPLIQNVPTVPLVKVPKSLVVYVLRQLLPHLLEELLLGTPPQLDLHLLSWQFLLLLDFKSTTKKYTVFISNQVFSCKRNTNH